MLLSSLEALALADRPALTGSVVPDLKILATNWGFSGNMDTFCAKAKAAGYDGIEVWWPGEAQAQDELFAALDKHDLDVGFLCGGWEADPTKHFEQFRAMVSAAAGNTRQRPLYINCHSGRDYFSMEQNRPFIDFTTRVAQDTGLLICHETHRSRILFAAHVARQYMEHFPELRLTLDVSHWCNVHESLLQDQETTVALALERVDHIHARIGHPEGPQVNDPRAPEWEATVKAHLNWWDRVVARKSRNGETVTFLTEFGPPNYMPTLPFTGQPVADQWAINVHMMELLRKRYAQ